MPPRLLTAYSALPPEGAAAPAARQSRFRGPGLKGYNLLHSLFTMAKVT